LIYTKLIYTINEWFKLKAVILAGGLGTRLRPLTYLIPKPLLPLGEHSVLEISITKLKQHGVNEIFVATNYKSQMFEDYFGDGSKFGVKINYSREKEPLGTAGPLKLLMKHLQEPFLVIYGDILTSLNFQNLKEFHVKNKSDFTLVTKEAFLPVRYGIVESDGNMIKSIEEKPDIKNQINAGIYFLNPSVVDEIPDGFFHMTDLAKKLIKQGKKVMKYQLDDYWLDIGQMQDYEKAQKDIKEGTFDL